MSGSPQLVLTVAAKARGYYLGAACYPMRWRKGHVALANTGGYGCPNVHQSCLKPVSVFAPDAASRIVRSAALVWRSWSCTGLDHPTALRCANGLQHHVGPNRVAKAGLKTDSCGDPLCLNLS